jgi:hypothetical protein
MKKLFILCLFALSLTQVNAQSVDDIVKKNIEARGGLELLNKLKTLVVESEIDANGQLIPIKNYVVHQKGSRMEMSLMGMDNYMVLNNTEGSVYFPIQGQKSPEPMPKEMHEAMKSQMDLMGEFIGWKEKGLKLELQGDEDLEGTMCFKILCTYPTGKEKRFFIDKESYQIIRENEKSVVNGKEMEQNQDFSNFKKQDGYTLPFAMTGPMGGIKVKKYMINGEVKDSLFEIAKKK